MIETDEPGRPAQHAVVLAAPDLSLLLVAWLDELIYLTEVEDFIPRRAERVDVASTTLSATVTGRRARPLHVVKAVTLHDLELAAKGGAWRGRVVLDV